MWKLVTEYHQPVPVKFLRHLSMIVAANHRVQRPGEGRSEHHLRGAGVAEEDGRGRHDQVGGLIHAFLRHYS